MAYSTCTEGKWFQFCPFANSFMLSSEKDHTEVSSLFSEGAVTEVLQSMAWQIIRAVWIGRNSRSHIHNFTITVMKRCQHQQIKTAKKDYWIHKAKFWIKQVMWPWQLHFSMNYYLLAGTVLLATACRSIIVIHMIVTLYFINASVFTFAWIWEFEVHFLVLFSIV